MATDAEIRAVLAQARRLRAEAMKDMARTVGRRAIASVDRAGDFLGKSAERGPPARVGDFDGAVQPDLGGRGLAGINCCPI